MRRFVRPGVRTSSGVQVEIVCIVLSKYGGEARRQRVGQGSLCAHVLPLPVASLPRRRRQAPHEGSRARVRVPCSLATLVCCVFRHIFPQFSAPRNPLSANFCPPPPLHGTEPHSLGNGRWG